MAHNALQMEMPPSPATAAAAIQRHPLLPLQTSSSDLTTHSTFADASDVDADIAPDSTTTPSTATTSIYSASEPASQSLPQSRIQLQSQSSPKILAEQPAMPTSSQFESNPVARRDHPTTTTTAVTTKTPPRSPSTTTRSRSVTLDTPIQFSHGQKRTAAGEMKMSVSPAQFPTPRNRLPGASASGRHSRTTSTDSNASRIAEVSTHLRAKLSYAASRVESQRQLRSPESKNYSPISPARTTSSTRPRQSLSFSHAETRNISLMPNGQNAGVPGKLDMSQIPKLAPPADIVARNGAPQQQPRRRPNPNLPNNNNNSSSSFKSPNRPSLSHQSSNSSSQNNFLARDTSPPPHSQPSYPQRTPATGQRTPSQNALMEQDAIETLLFMSSPENSGYRANTQQSSQPSNLNAVSSAMPPPPSQNSQPILEPGVGGPRNNAQANFADNGSCNNHLANNTPGTTHSGVDSRDEIDRILDEMPDSDSDMEDGWFARLAAQHPPPQEQYPINNQPVHDSSDMINAGSQQGRMWTSFP